MRGIKPDAEVWGRVNQAILGENAGVVVVTLIDGICSLLQAAGVVSDDLGARVHLSAMILSPDDGSPAGSLLPFLRAEFAKLEDGKWRQ